MNRQQQSTQLRAQRESLRKSADEFSREQPRPNRERLAAFWVQQAPTADTVATTDGAGDVSAASGDPRRLFMGRVVTVAAPLKRSAPLQRSAPCSWSLDRHDSAYFHPKAVQHMAKKPRPALGCWIC